MKTKSLLLLSIAFCAAIQIQAQNNTVSAGADAEGSNGSISYSNGQVAYTSTTGINQTVELDRKTLNPEIPNTAEFKTFLNYFLVTAYSGKKFDSLVYVSSPLIREFINKEIGFGRFWNNGIYNNLYDSDGYGYNFGDGNWSEIEPNVSNLTHFLNKDPKEGFCDEATSPDGIYYKQVFKLPGYYDMEKDMAMSAPSKYNNFKKMIVEIQHNKWIIKTLYFIEYKNNWYLLYIDDCDCSA